MNSFIIYGTVGILTNLQVEEKELTLRLVIVRLIFTARQPSLVTATGSSDDFGWWTV